MMRNKRITATTLVLAIGASLCLFAGTLRAASNEQVIHTFGSGSDGQEPLSGLVSDSLSNLYGTTLAGGEYDAGTVFELSPSEAGWNEKVIYNFEGDRGYPKATLVLDGEGNLFGTTSGGGVCCGYVFELSPKPDGSWREKVIYKFVGGLYDGYLPVGTLVFDAAGNLYGATTWGGNPTCKVGGFTGCGTVFKLTPKKNGKIWRETILHFFDQKSGQPGAGVIVDAAGTLYGTTPMGGTSKACYQGCGTVFELKRVGGRWRETTIFNVQGGGNGSSPTGSLLRDASGNLYGALYKGGNGSGLIFRLVPRVGRWQESVVYTFCTLNNCADGGSPVGLSSDSHGNIYGATFGGGTAGDFSCGQYPSPCGTVFKVVPSKNGWRESVLYSFPQYQDDGMFPQAEVLVETGGTVYGTTFGGGGGTECTFGAYGGCGTVFEIAP